jgi:hypothetical protein
MHKKRGKLLVLIFVLFIFVSPVFAQDICLTSEELSSVLDEEIRAILAENNALTEENIEKIPQLIELVTQPEEIDIREIEDTYFETLGKEEEHDLIEKIENDRFELEKLKRLKEVTESVVDVDKYVVVSGSKTSKVVIKIHPYTVLKEVSVYEIIPKEIIEDVSEIKSTNLGYTILEPDPLIVWYFEEISDDLKLTYEINKKIASDPKTLIIAKEIATQPKQGIRISRELILKIVIPLLLIPLIVYVIVTFGRFKESIKKLRK